MKHGSPAEGIVNPKFPNTIMGRPFLQRLLSEKEVVGHLASSLRIAVELLSTFHSQAGS